MNNKKLIKIAAATLATAAVTAGTVFATTNLLEIKAYLNYDLKIKYDMQEQVLLDANGNRVYPITYDGTTYLPVRAVGSLFGVEVGWDGDTYSVLLGKTGEAKNFIDTFREVYCASPTSFVHHQSGDNSNKTITIGGVTYNCYINMSLSHSAKPKTVVTYELGGKYSTLQFDIMSDSYTNTSLNVVGDDDKLLCTIDMPQGDSWKTVSVDVSGMSQVKFVTNADTVSGKAYIINATID